MDVNGVSSIPPPPEASSTHHPPTRSAAHEKRGKSEAVDETEDSKSGIEPGRLLQHKARAEDDGALRAGPSAGAEEPERATDAEPEEDPELARFLDHPTYKLSFRVDAETKEVVVSVIDRETDDVVRQIPPEELLRLAERLKSSRGSFVSSKA